MPQSFKNAWRWLIGASAAAMLIASVAPAANAQSPDTGIIKLCVARNGRIIGVNHVCKNHNFELVWNIPGPQGPRGTAGRCRPGRRTGSGGSDRIARLGRSSGSDRTDGRVGPDGSRGSARSDRSYRTDW